MVSQGTKSPNSGVFGCLQGVRVTKWGVIITPVINGRKINKMGKGRVWLLKFSPLISPDSEVDFMAPPMYHWFPTCRRDLKSCPCRLAKVLSQEATTEEVADFRRGFDIPNAVAGDLGGLGCARTVVLGCRDHLGPSWMV